MNRSVIFLAMLTLSSVVFGQQLTDKEKVEKACMGYIEGFYQGDKSKLEVVLKPTLHKFGYWKNKDTDDFGKPIYMTFEEALEYADDVKAKKNFAKEDAPKKVEILDIMEHIAAAKVTAWWGYDYMLLSKEGDKWMIEEVLWQGPFSE